MRFKTLTTLSAAGSLGVVLLAGPLAAAEPTARPSIAQAPKADSKDALFGDVPAAAGAEKAQAPKADSKDALFGDIPPAAGAEKGPAATSPGWTGYIAAELARDYKSPEHWSNARLRAEVGRRGEFNSNVKWKIGGRAEYDAAYDRSGFYNSEVRHDQRYDFMLRENYLDITAGNLEMRLGRQHIVWGEMVGLFIADVVSARDFREFILPEPDLETIRIPQWAARAEYFKGDYKAEAIWIPVPSFDNIGKPGAEFFVTPIPGPGGTNFLGEQIPTRNLSNSNYGLRLTALKNGWDMAGFYYHSLDVNPTYYRSVSAAPVPVFTYQARHDSINQFGGTLAKDLGRFVLKAEAVYTDGRQFGTTTLTQPNGLVGQRTIDYAIGADLNVFKETRLNLQFFQRIFTNHSADILEDRYESGASVLVETPLSAKWEARALFVRSLNRNDSMVRTRLAWKFEKNWRLLMGVDIFSGPPLGVFGRYQDKDRIYSEVRYSF
jgi:hypothetical protein